ncbi:MAG TPA: DUF3105 domain-containing protein [Pseudonocardiaceae bacterium]|nr:DUF3105 domain-containing protein [Pseudonocardiaceae bacterium]
MRYLSAFEHDQLDLAAPAAPTVQSRKARVGVVALAVAALVVASCSQPRPQGSPPPGTATYPQAKPAHVTGKVQYDHSPPVGGNHSPVWLNCGIYDSPVANENAVHDLEHGAVWITYLPSLPAAELDRLRALVKASYDGTGRYVVLSPYPGQSAPIIASAWGHQLTLQTATDPRLQGFINYFRQGPQNLEPGAPCSGGIGRPIG